MIVHTSSLPRVGGYKFVTSFHDDGYAHTALVGQDGWFCEETDSYHVDASERADVICAHRDHLEYSYFGALRA